MAKAKFGVSLVAVFLVCMGFALGYITSHVQPISSANAIHPETDLAATENDAATSGSRDNVATRSPVKATQDRDLYFPGTEDLKPDEMRVTALGTGMPSARPKQAAACFLVELGNGDKFLFDIGSGSHERIAAQKIPYDYLDKVFIGHLHVDHFGDLPTFWLGGTTMNRLVPLRVWGPSGSTPELGTKYCMEKMQEMCQWDIGTRSGVIDFRGGELDVTEFAFDGVNEVIYNENDKGLLRWKH
jgi:ribonuclease Z